MAGNPMKLYTYYRSSSSFRVRIALNWKGIPYEPVFVHLAKGEQQAPGHLRRNPQGLVPVLEDGDTMITQSVAILEYLEEKYPQRPLLPKGTADRAHVRSLVQLIACDIQPLNNLKVLKYLKDPLGQSQAAIDAWYRHWITQNFNALEARVNEWGKDYCFGAAVTMADCLFIPQIWNARRFAADLSAFPALLKVEEALYKLPAFDKARPENQPDFEKA
ncbi:MAG TPA: maleylacetoacetate isomerase [Sphingomonadales bacterium]|nr:maleylacetoacetate isomerase [Sphingomonadales bacterium]